jgi:hypothetical protein
VTAAIAAAPAERDRPVTAAIAAAPAERDRPVTVAIAPAPAERDRQDILVMFTENGFAELVHRPARELAGRRA